LQGGGHRFDPDTLHFFRRCANRIREDAIGGLDLGAAVDLQFGDQMPKKRFRLLWLGLGDEVVEVVGDRGEFGGRGRVCALVGRSCGEFGLLAAELVQTSVEAGQAFVAAFGGELALFEGLEVALE
jgi:hypothetical protein